jgi:hypothetical protein
LQVGTPQKFAFFLETVRIFGDVDHFSAVASAFSKRIFIFSPCRWWFL